MFLHAFVCGVGILCSATLKNCLFLFISGTIQRRIGLLQPLQTPHHIPSSALLRHREFPTLATEGRGEVKVGPQATEPLPENGLLTISSPETTFALCHLNLIEILEFLSCSPDVI